MHCKSTVELYQERACIPMCCSLQAAVPLLELASCCTSTRIIMYCKQKARCTGRTYTSEIHVVSSTTTLYQVLVVGTGRYAGAGTQTLEHGAHRRDGSLGAVPWQSYAAAAAATATATATTVTRATPATATADCSLYTRIYISLNLTTAVFSILVARAQQ